MEEESAQNRPNFSFSIEEDSGTRPTKPDMRRKCILLVAAAFITLTVVAILLCFLGPLKTTDGTTTLGFNNEDTTVALALDTSTGPEFHTIGDDEMETTPGPGLDTSVGPVGPMKTTDGTTTLGFNNEDTTFALALDTSTGPEFHTIGDDEMETTPGPGLDTSVGPDNMTILEWTDASKTNVNLQTAVTTFSVFPSPSCPPVSGDQIAGCVKSLTVNCQDICQANDPNRDQIRETNVHVLQTFNVNKNIRRNFNCHLYFMRFKCAIMDPSCDDSVIRMELDGDYAFDAVNIPYQHDTYVLCDFIHFDIECAVSIVHILLSLPGPYFEDVCFGVSSMTDSKCDPNPCLNGGDCFTYQDQQYCKCNSEFHGNLCQHESEMGLTISRHTCVPVPNECHSLLPYNETSGISLKDTDLAYIASWDTVATVASRDNTTKKLFCALTYPMCRSEGTVSYTVCSNYCWRVQREVMYLSAAMDFPPLDCHKTIRDESIPEGMKCIS